MKLCDVLLKAWYNQSKLDYSLFTKHDRKQIVVLLIYVDDLLISRNSDRLIDELQHVLQSSFRMKDLGELWYFLGIQIARSEKGIVLSQRKYVLELISDAGLSSVKVTKTPMETNLKLTSRKYDKHLNLNKEDKPLNDVSLYRRLIGKVLYLTITRSYVSFAVQNLT